MLGENMVENYLVHRRLWISRRESLSAEYLVCPQVLMNAEARHSLETPFYMLVFLCVHGKHDAGGKRGAEVRTAALAGNRWTVRFPPKLSDVWKHCPN